jgi:dihydrofolate reductase
MSKLVEATHVSLGGEIGSPDWAHPYLDEQFAHYAQGLLDAADALLLGRRTYEGLSSAYTKMAEAAASTGGDPFVDRMNSIPKFVASATLSEASWNSTVIPGDVSTFVAELKYTAGMSLLKYGTGSLDTELMAHGLVDEFHLFLTPVAAGRGRHLFEDVVGAPHLDLVDVTRFDNGVVALVYSPKFPA